MRIEDANKGSFRGHGINTAQNHRIQMVLSTIMLISETGFLTQSSVFISNHTFTVTKHCFQFQEHDYFFFLYVIFFKFYFIFKLYITVLVKGKRCPDICYSFIIGPYVSFGELKVY